MQTVKIYITKGKIERLQNYIGFRETLKKWRYKQRHWIPASAPPFHRPVDLVWWNYKNGIFTKECSCFSESLRYFKYFFNIMLKKRNFNGLDCYQNFRRLNVKIPNSMTSQNPKLNDQPWIKPVRFFKVSPGSPSRKFVRFSNTTLCFGR
jgi:hypothetical protein